MGAAPGAFLPDGGFFLADGYGSFRIHRYDKRGQWLSKFGKPGKGDGEFDTPHGIWIDARPGRAPSLVVADRANKRLQWFTFDGQHLKTLDGFILPANIDSRNDVLLVPDLSARVTLLDGNNQVITHLGEDPEWRAQVLKDGMKLRGNVKGEGWVSGKFLHPHDACFVLLGTSSWLNGSTPAASPSCARWAELASPRSRELNAADMPPSSGLQRRCLVALSLAMLLAGLSSPPARAAAAPGPVASFRAGARSIDISPTGFPVRVNAMFTERTATAITDPLYAKALALDDGTNRVVLCVVDTCMIPRDLIEQAKAEASRSTGLPMDRMLVSATHSHSAPSAMGCLGSRVDPRYALFLPGRIAAAIRGAVENLAPARIGWAQGDDWEHTFNRRWVRRPDRVLNDPFGRPTVRANMHPGYESPDAVGPSGPVDPQLSVIALQRADGRPLALLANYSMHYYGSALLSSDYYGRFAAHVGALLGAEDSFVGIMSQGTSGDLMWMDYGAPRREIGYDAYAREVAAKVARLVQNLQWRDSAPLKMAERRLPLGYRVPDDPRLAWARETAARLGDKLPQTQPEIYALEAILLHDRPRTELVLQGLRIGELGIAAIPNEVFALTGLKVKRQSPFAATFNVELANGAEGYIPPPEQHKLGGYTTWPARTAGLEPNAEPRIVEAALSLLEEVAGRPRRPLLDPAGPYARAVLNAKPAAFWRLDEMVIPVAKDSAGPHDAVLADGVALYLAGADGRIGHQPPEPAGTNAFSGARINRAFHFAGGRLRASMPLPESYSVELWLWNGLPVDVRPVTGYFLSRGPDGDKAARGEHLGLGGTDRPGMAGRLILFNGNERDELLVGRSVLALRAWHHVVLVREGGRVRVHLDGRVDPDLAGPLALTVPVVETSLFLGGRCDGMFNLEGKLDEIAVYDRALSAAEIAAHYHASALTPPPLQQPRAGTATVLPTPVTQPPLSPEESLKKVHIKEGYRVELVASEPLTLDPVAIDWDMAGRLWVVEMADYPLGMDGKGRPGGRVRVLEDLDGDGRYDKSTIFAEGLSFPNGLLTWRDGVIVTAAPEVLFLRDTDGDGRADVREVLASGLSTGNQQLRANGLRWGLDGWVHCAAGGHYRGYGEGSHLRTRLGDVLVGSRDFRFKPDTGELEPTSGPSQFGRNRDDWGHWFGTQNSRPLWHYVLADHYLRRDPHVPAPDPTRQVVVPLNPKVWPVSVPERRFHSFDNAGHFTSACSGMIYRDDHLFPASPSEMQAFTCEPFHNLVQHNVITPDGVSFAAHRASGEDAADFFASEDRWCRPVMTRTGPDGALWVVDMYRYIIEHPDWLPAIGKEELLPHYRLGEDRGRIYRVLPVGRPPRVAPRLDVQSTAGLIAALDSPNEWQRDKAHMLLTWRLRGSSSAVRGQIRNDFHAVLAGRNPLARLHALCVLDAVDALTPELVIAGLRDTEPGVRENAVRLAERFGEEAVIAEAAALVDDPDPKVRLQLGCSLGAWNLPSAAQALARLAVKDHAEPFLRAAVLSSAVPHVRVLCDTIARAGGSALADFAEDLTLLAAGLEQRDALAALLAPVLTAQDKQFSADQLRGFGRMLDALDRAKFPRAALGAKDDALGATFQRAAAVFGFARRTTADDVQSVPLRAAAAQLLCRDAGERPGALRTLASWLDPGQPPDLQMEAVRSLAGSGDGSVPATLLGAWSSLLPAPRVAVTEALLSRESWAIALLEHMAAGHDFPLDPVQRTRLLQHTSRKVRELAGKVLQSAGARAKVMEEFQPALGLAGDAARGRVVFSSRCVACHRLDGLGAELGPDLKSVAQHPPEKLLASILDPSLDVQPGFAAYQCRLSTGEELYGLVTAETANSITFRSTDGTVRLVSRRDIAELKGGSKSLMPDGLEAGLTPRDLADLIQFLRSGGAGAGGQEK